MYVVLRNGQLKLYNETNEYAENKNAEKLRNDKKKLKNEIR